MAGRKRAMTVVATHSYERDPEATARAIEMWARYLASNAADIHRELLINPAGRGRRKMLEIS